MVEGDPLRYFRIEARELHDALTDGLLRLERGELPSDGVGLLLRQAHTLKGAARVVREPEIAENAHALEEVLGRISRGAAVEPAAISEMLRHLDAIGERLRQISGGATAAPEAPEAATPSEPTEVVEGAAPPGAEAANVVRLETRDFDGLSFALSEASARAAAVGRVGAPLHAARRAASEVLDRLEREKALALARGREAPEALLQRMEAVCRSLGDLDRDLSWLLEGLGSDLREAREQLGRLRLIPVNTLFAALQRAARDAATLLGKQVRLELQGGEVRVDGPVLALVREALLHLVRNAVAHGIGTPEERRARGKPEEGVVLLRAERQGGQIAFVCRDDGGGIDPMRVVAAAVARGEIGAAEARALSREEALRLILRPGFSTRAQADEVAGRGVGLDVVQGVAARVGGELLVDSEPGGWTEFTLRVPPSLTSVRVLALEADGVRSLVPIDAVRWTLHLSSRDVLHGPEGESIVHGDEALPFAPLARVLGRPGRRLRERALSAVVLRAGPDQAAIGVDRILGLSEVLVRPLPSSLGPVPLLLGAALDAAGDPEAVLEPRALIEAVRGAGGPVAEPRPEPPLVMVVDDSLTTRMLEKSILESAGYRVQLASSGEEALARAREVRPAAALVDVEMPGIDGFEVVRRLREDPVLHDMPAVLVTSRRAPEDRRRGMEVGARAYVVKSEFSQERLLDIIRGLVGPRSGEGGA